MRVFSYILTALVTIFVLNVALSFSLPAYRDALVQARTSIFPVTKKAPDAPPGEEKKSESTRLVESLDRIDRHIESLSEKNIAGTGIVIMSGAIQTGALASTGTSTISSGTILKEEEPLPKEPEIPIS